jgi:Leucine-rich repeat (LRR) protein
MTQTNQTALSFPNMCLKFVTINMFNMNLQSIDFSSNKLVSIPNEIVEIPYLRVLKLQNNHIARMPAETCRLTNLTQLILSNNKLKAIFPQIDRLHSLEVLLLDNN